MIFLVGLNMSAMYFVNTVSVPIVKPSETLPKPAPNPPKDQVDRQPDHQGDRDRLERADGGAERRLQFGGLKHRIHGLAARISKALGLVAATTIGLNHPNGRQHLLRG